MKNKKIDTEFITTIQDKNLDKVKRLIKNGVNVNFKTVNFAFSPLFYAMTHGAFDIFKYLIECGADPSVIDASGHTLLSYLSSSVSKSMYNSEHLIKYFKDYRNQKKLIDKFSNMLFVLRENNFLHKRCYIKYEHLLTANDLNLI